jgi:hypothetical protein
MEKISIKLFNSINRYDFNYFGLSIFEFKSNIERDN